MFSKDWKANQAMIPAATIVPYSSRGLAGDAAGAPQHDAEQQDDQARADEAQLLTRDGEDEVGLLLGHELAGGLGAVEEALAAEAAGADGDAGLVGVVADARRVERRVGEGGEAVDLVLVEDAELPDRHARPPRPAVIRPTIQRLEAPEASSTPSTMHADHHHRAEVRHQHDRRAIGPAARPSAWSDGAVVGVLAVARVDAGGQQHRHAQDDRDLGELGGLEREAARRAGSRRAGR